MATYPWMFNERIYLRPVLSLISTPEVSLKRVGIIYNGSKQFYTTDCWSSVTPLVESSHFRLILRIGFSDELRCILAILYRVEYGIFCHSDMLGPIQDIS